MTKSISNSLIFFGWFLSLGFAAPVFAGEAKAPAPKINWDLDRIGPPPIEQPYRTVRPVQRVKPNIPTRVTQKPRKFTPFIPPKDYSPPIIYVSEPRHDFGTVFKGETIQHRFWFENKGGSPLIVKKVRPSCGCALVNQASLDKVIAPGGKGSFELKIETSRLPAGRTSKYADINTNDPKMPNSRVYIQGKVETIVKVEPQNPKIITVRGTGQAETEITLSKAVQEEIKILGAKAKSGRLALDLKEVQPGSLFKLLVKTNYPPDLTQSYFSENITLDVKVGERELSQNFYVSVQLKSRIETTPRMVYFRRTDFQPLKDKGTPAVKTVQIKAALDAPYQFKITSFKADSPDPFFKLGVQPVQEGREYRLTVTVDKMPEVPSERKYRSLKGNIKLTTSDPEIPEIDLRCVAFF